eukprot:TRINITY_DN39868_c0_g1_i1.p1 TRINITY_DN39868_c0_g1~~TRINITY_DN39868_c0_g1_i1.p1  ORF type:complete len:115 (-),score=15.33 TRINITY_DN39868_c0_g1_i1:74-418(-)
MCKTGSSSKKGSRTLSLLVVVALLIQLIVQLGDLVPCPLKCIARALGTSSLSAHVIAHIVLVGSCSTFLLLQTHSEMERSVVLFCNLVCRQALSCIMAWFHGCLLYTSPSPRDS